MRTNDTQTVTPTDFQTNWEADIQTDRPTDGQPYCQAYRRRTDIYRWPRGQSYRRTDIQTDTDGQTNRHADIQADRHTDGSTSTRRANQMNWGYRMSAMKKGFGMVWKTSGNKHSFQK